MQRLTQLWKSSRKGKIAIGCGGVIVLLFACIILSALFGEESPTPTPTLAAVKAEDAAVREETDTERSTEPLAPTATAEPAATAPPPSVGLGDEVTTEEWAVTVLEVKQAKSIFRKDRGLEAKGQWIIVYGEVRNLTTDSVSVHSSDFELTTPSLKGELGPDGDATGAAGLQAGVDSTVAGFLGLSVEAGQTHPLVIAFDVPEGVEETTLQVVDANTGIALGSVKQLASLPTPVPTDTPVPTETPIPTPTYSVVNLGEEVRTGRWTIMISDVKQSDILLWNSRKLEPSGRWVIVSGEVRNLTTDSISISSRDFWLTTPSLKGEIRPNGDATGAAGLQAGVESTVAGLGGFRVQAGQSYPLVIAFDVAEVVNEVALQIDEANTGIALGSVSQLAMLPTPAPTDTPTPRPTNTPKPSPTPLPPGMAYENPVPVGKPVATDNDFEITVLGIKRDAWQEIEQANMFNQPAREGYEYVLVHTQVKNLGSEDETQQVASYEFRLTGSYGVIRSSTSVVINNELEGEMFGGGILEGQLVYEIPRDETNLILIYDPGIAVSPRWLAIEEISKPIVRPIEAVSGVAERGLKKGAPAALGEAVLSDQGIEVTVLEIERNAWSTIHEMNQFNEKPMAGKEYILTRIRARYIEGREQTRHVSSTDFRVTGEKGVIYKRPSLVIENELDVELFRNGVFAGYLAFEVTEGEQELTLIYDPGLGSAARYLSLE